MQESDIRVESEGKGVPKEGKGVQDKESEM
jgi:hypothetical protein